MLHLSILRLARAARRHVDAHLQGRESGAVATIVAILIGGGVVLGCAALTIDTGSLMWERRQLQNGADAAALSAAQTCASAAPCNPGVSGGSRLANLAGANATDGVSAIDSICGSSAARAQNPALSLCPTPAATPALVDCPAVPSGLGSSSYVEVRTKTLTTGGSTILPPFVAQTLAGGYTGETVRACARAAWTTPSGGTVIPLTISTCEFNNYTANGTHLVPPPPYTSGYPPTPTVYEHAIYFHNTTGASHCPAGPSGFDLSGGFGWLNSSTNCAVSISATGWVDDKTGVSQPNDCNLATMTGQTVYLPIYVQTNGLTGTNGQYLIDGFAAFYLTGMRFPGNNVNSVATGRRLCSSPDTCIYGWFTTGLIPRGQFSTGSTPTPRGATTVVAAG